MSDQIIKAITYVTRFYDARFRCWRCNQRDGGWNQSKPRIAYVQVHDLNDELIFQGNYCEPCQLIKIAEKVGLKIEVPGDQP